MAQSMCKNNNGQIVKKLYDEIEKLTL